MSAEKFRVGNLVYYDYDNNPNTRIIVRVISMQSEVGVDRFVGVPVSNTSSYNNHKIGVANHSYVKSIFTPFKEDVIKEISEQLNKLEQNLI